MHAGLPPRQFGRHNSWLAHKKPSIFSRWFYHWCYYPPNIKEADYLEREKTDGAQGVFRGKPPNNDVGLTLKKRKLFLNL